MKPMGYSEYSGISNIKHPVTPILTPINNPNRPQTPPPGKGFPTEYVLTVGKEKKWNIITLVITILVAVLLTAGSVLVGGIFGGIILLLACVPLTLIILSTFWVGRWNQPPLRVRTIALLWGMVVSVLIATGVGLVWQTFLPTEWSAEPIMLGVQAPIVEEFAKGIFLLLLVLFFKKYYTNTIDGIVYVLLVAGGFAFTENLLYLSQSLNGWGLFGLTQTFFLRGMLSPFAHGLFTLPLAVLLSWGVRRNLTPWKLVGLFLIGWVPAMVLHSLWNLGSYFTNNIWSIFYALVQIPLFIGVAFLVYLLRKQEINRTLKAVSDYSWQGWFTPEEVETFGTFRGRKHFISWAKKQNPVVVHIAHKVLREITELTHVRENLTHNHGVKETNLLKQASLLASLKEDRMLLSKL